MYLTSDEREADKSIESAAELLGKLLEWRLPGHYAFESEFPAEYAAWMRAADTYMRSGKRELRRLGLLMRDVAVVMTEIDATPADTWKFRRKYYRLKTLAERLADTGRLLAAKAVSANV